MLSIALALIPSVVVSFILREREQQLKHQQLVSGMSMCGYWASNAMSDMLAAYVPIVLIIILNAAFKLDNPYSWLFLLLYPLAVVPFTYMTSFLFTDDTTAQICTLFLHFLAGGILTAVVYVLQLVPTTAIAGDIIRYVGLIIPSYCVTHALILSKELDTLVQSRQSAIEGDYPDLPPWNPDLWSWENLRSDAAALVAHFVFGLLVVAICESPLFDRCKDCACSEAAEEREETDMDDDVVGEEERVAAMTAFKDNDDDIDHERDAESF